MKNIRIFYLKIFIILVGKFSVYLNRHVFVMQNSIKKIYSTLLQFRQMKENVMCVQKIILYTGVECDVCKK